MEEKNRNTSDAFGKYNNSAGEFKNVSSSDWAPISAGRTDPRGSNSYGAERQSAKKKPQSSKKSASKPSGKSKNTKSKATDERRFISEGAAAPAKKKKPQSKSESPKKASGGKKSQPQTKKSTKQKQSSPSRTPMGRDLREDARKQQKHREDLIKSREDYKRRSKEGENHDEISRSRNANKRKKMALRNAAPVAIVLAFAIFFIGMYCYNRGALIENIIIDGSDIYTAEEIYQAAGISRGKNMLSLREGRIRRELTKKLPYIKDVRLELELPDTVVLTIKSTRGKYIISNGTSSYTLDADGKVVSTLRESPEEGMYLITGFESQEFSEGDTYKPSSENAERYELMKQIVTLFDKGNVVDSAEIELQNTDDVRVVYKDKIAVYLGDCNNLEEQIPYASGIIAQVDAAGKGGYIDMRFEPAPFRPGSMEIQ